MKLKKIHILLLVAVLVLNFTGCKGETTFSSEPQSSVNENSKLKNYITLLYSASDSFNPYTVKTAVNRQLCQLIYDSLVRLDNNFNPIFEIAKEVVNGDKECRVKINTPLFSDGTTLTAEDVVYSFNLAKNSATSYGYKLYEAVSARAEGIDTVVFNLTKTDIYFSNVLNFPIIKAGSEAIADSDSVLQPPIGSGIYKVNANRDGLILNQSYNGKKPSITEIRLKNAPDTDSVSHYAQVGAADMYYNDISDDTILRMSGKKEDINLNNLVYIGINQNYGALSQNALRQALSSGIDRIKLSENAYYNNATPANGFFHPAWSEVKSVQNIEITANSQITIENLEKIGYNRLDSNGIRINANGVPLKFTLLVNSENRIRANAAQLIAKSLLNYGILVTVVEKSYAQYVESLANGNFQLYLGEIKLTENMDVSALVVPGGSATYGLPISNNDSVETADQLQPPQNQNEESSKTPAEVVTGFYSGQNTVTDIATVLQSDMPFIPICYRNGVLFYNENIENVNNSSESDIYSSIDSYRYYIDKNGN